MEFIFKDPKDFGTTFNLWQYTDNHGDWDAVNKKGMSCEEKVRRSNGNVHEKLVVGPTGKATVNIEALGGVRRRFHFFTLVKCGGYGDVEYKAHFTRKTSAWGREFGVDIAGLNTIHIVFFIAYLAIAGAAAWNFKVFQSKKGFIHPIVKVFTISVIAQFLNIMLEMIHWCQFQKNGTGVFAFKVIGDICEIVGSVSFLLMLMLLAQGWAVSSGAANANLKQRTIVAGVVLFYGFLKIIALFLTFFANDPSKLGTANSIYVFYNVLLIATLGFAGFYAYSLWNTLSTENNPVKRKFMTLLEAFTLYLVANAASACISYAVDPWVRQMIVDLVALCTLLVAHGAMLSLLWNSHAFKYFELETPVELASQFTSDAAYDQF